MQVAVLGCFAVLAWGCTVFVRAPLAIVQLMLAALTLYTGSRFLPGRAGLATPSIWRSWAALFTAFAKTRYRSLSALLPIGYLVPLLWSEVPGFTLKHVQLVLPALLIPLACFVFDELLTRWRKRIWLFFLACAAFLGLVTAAYAWLNAPALALGLGQGQAVPTPLTHVRFATALAFAGVLGLLLASENKLGKPSRVLAGVLALISIVAVHFIAVRTGIVLFYLGALVLLVRLLSRRWSVGMVAVAFLVLGVAGATAAWQFPAVQQRIAYMQYDLERADSPDATQYSDAARLLSYRAAWSIVEHHPITGSPKGDFRAAMRQHYAAMGHPNAHLLPTNQYLFSWGLAGLAGIVGLLAVFIGPLLEQGWWRRPMLAETLLMLAALCLVESPLASDVGLVLSFLMLGLSQVGGVEEA